MEGALIVIEVVAVKDGPGMGRYVAAAEAQMRSRGARPIGKGFEVIEGDPQGVMRTVLHWPSVQAYRDWQESEEYRELHALRLASAQLNIIGIPLDAA